MITRSMAEFPAKASSSIAVSMAGRVMTAVGVSSTVKAILAVVTPPSGVVARRVTVSVPADRAVTAHE